MNILSFEIEYQSQMGITLCNKNEMIFLESFI